MAELNLDQLGMLLAGTTRIWRTRLDQQLKPLGLSQGKWTTLVHLAKGGEGLSQRELAGLIGIEEPTLVGLLDRLEADGWIERRPLTRDRRCKAVFLRDRAHPTIQNMVTIAAELRNKLLQGISRHDLRICARVLQEIKMKAEDLS